MAINCVDWEPNDWEDSGEDPDDCWTCQGRGEIYEGQLDPELLEDGELIECPHCEGSGLG